MNSAPKKRGRPRKYFSYEDMTLQYPGRTIVWCTEAGDIAADQTVPSEYARLLSEVEELELKVTFLESVLSENGRFERCDEDGTPNPNGSNWHMRDAVAPKPTA